MKKISTKKVLRRELRSRNVARKRTRDAKRRVSRSARTAKDRAGAAAASKGGVISLSAYGTGNSMQRAIRLFGVLAALTAGSLLLVYLVGALVGGF